MVTLLSLTFDREFAFTSLPDTATSVAMAMCTALCWLTLEALRREQWFGTRGFALRFGLAGSFLINLKQSNVVLLVLLSCAYLLVTFRDPRISVGKAMRLLPAMLGPGLIVWGAWHFHVAANVADGEMGILPKAEWHTDMLPEIITAMGRHILDHPLHFTLMFGLSLAGLARPWCTRVSVDRLLIIVAVTWLGYTCFLLFAYIAIFNPGEAHAAAQYWRYSTHFGLVGMFTAVVLLIWWWQGRQVGRLLRVAALASLVLLPVAAVYLGNRVTTDEDFEVLYCRRIGRDLADALPDGARLAVFNPTSAGYCGFFIRYEISRPGRGPEPARRLAS